jgi:hypothetical protein
VIDLNDGTPQLAASAGNGTGMASLTPAQLQPIVTQALAAWGAAGADPLALSNVANYAFHIAPLPDGELGYEVPGQIWIDPTAAGWGWSLGSTPAPGQMDLLTVVSHEVGHVLGLGDHASGTDVMTTALQTGVRRLPEASGSTGSGVASSVVPLGSIVSTLSAGMTFRVSLPSFGPQAPVSAATVVPVGLDRGYTDALIPAQQPPNWRGESGGDGAPPPDEARDALSAEGSVPGSDLAGRPFDPSAASALGSELRQRACDACFADGSWLAEDRDTLWSGTNLGAAPDAAAVAALAFLGGSWNAQRIDSQPRRRRWLN